MFFDTTFQCITGSVLQNLFFKIIFFVALQHYLRSKSFNKLFSFSIV